jgi:hypothetical protein
MSHFVLGLQDIDKTKLMLVGGKGANLGELFKIEGICCREPQKLGAPNFNNRGILFRE